MVYCKDCKIKIGELCGAGYKNPTTSLEKALKQAKNGGEWPCTFSPHRAEFVALYRPGSKIVVSND
jgi:hypothetical protein